MSIVSLELAMNHLKAEPEDQDLVASKLAGAVEIAEQYMGRRIFATDEEMVTAKNSALTEFARQSELFAKQSKDPNLAAAGVLSLEITQEAIYALKMIARGILINPAIEVAILLILGTLYAYREDVVDGAVAEIPIAATHRLQPFRVMGV